MYIGRNESLGVNRIGTRWARDHGAAAEPAKRWVQQTCSYGSQLGSKWRGTGLARSSHGRNRILRGSLEFCDLAVLRYIPPPRRRRECSRQVGYRLQSTTRPVQPMRRQTGRSVPASTGRWSRALVQPGHRRSHPTALHRLSADCRQPAAHRTGGPGSMPPRSPP